MFHGLTLSLSPGHSLHACLPTSFHMASANPLTLQPCSSQEALLQDRLLGARKKRDRSQEMKVSFEASRATAIECCTHEA